MVALYLPTVTVEVMRLYQSHKSKSHEYTSNYTNTMYIKTSDQPFLLNNLVAPGEWVL